MSARNMENASSGGSMFADIPQNNTDQTASNQSP